MPALSSFSTSAVRNVSDRATMAALEQCPAFKGIGAEALEQLAATAAPRSFEERGRIFSEDGAARGFCILAHGAVKLSRVNATGRERVLQLVHPVESFGEEALFSDLGHVADATAIRKSEVVFLDKAGFLELMRRRPDVALNVFRAMTDKFNDLVRLLDDLTLKDVKTRLGHWLIRNCPDPTSDRPHCIELPMSKRMLASELGTIAETFSRTMAHFRQQNLVSVRGRNVTLLSPLRMMAALGEAAPLQLQAGQWAAV